MTAQVLAFRAKPDPSRLMRFHRVAKAYAFRSPDPYAYERAFFAMTNGSATAGDFGGA